MSTENDTNPPSDGQPAGYEFCVLDVVFLHYDNDYMFTVIENKFRSSGLSLCYGAITTLLEQAIELAANGPEPLRAYNKVDPSGRIANGFTQIRMFLIPTDTGEPNSSIAWRCVTRPDITDTALEVFSQQLALMQLHMAEDPMVTPATPIEEDEFYFGGVSWKGSN